MAMWSGVAGDVANAQEISMSVTVSGSTRRTDGQCSRELQLERYLSPSLADSRRRRTQFGCPSQYSTREQLQNPIFGSRYSFLGPGASPEHPFLPLSHSATGKATLPPDGGHVCRNVTRRVGLFHVGKKVVICLEEYLAGALNLR